MSERDRSETWDDEKGRRPGRPTRPDQAEKMEEARPVERGFVDDGLEVLDDEREYNDS